MHTASVTPTYDVVVAGLGGMGSAAAAELARRGQRVLGLDRYGPAHDRGSSHGGSRIIRQAYFEDPAYVPLLLTAYEGWARAERDGGEPLLTVTGGLMIGAEGSRVVSGSLHTARQWGLAHEMLDAGDLRRRFPTFVPTAETVALYEPQAGYLHPERSVQTFLRLADRAGADLRFGEAVTAWAAEGSGVRVTTGTATYTAGRLVLCPGAWAPELLADLGVPLVVERYAQFWLDPVGGIEPYLPDRHPVWVWELPDGRQPYGFPALDGSCGGVKTSVFRGGQPCTPDTIDRQVHDHEVDAMRDCLRDRVPTLAGPLVRAVTCMYTCTPDHHFVVGIHPEHSRVAVACGFSGHGFKFLPVVGEVVADLTTSGQTSHPVALFDPARERSTAP